jgi:ABC-2 type transport system permease protein
MKTLLHILSFEWKLLWRSNTLKVVLLIIFGAGVYGIYFGKFEIEKQQSRIKEVQNYERQQFDSLLHWAQLDTTLEANKARYEQAISPAGVGWSKHFTYYLTNEAPDAAGLCLGQRDLFPVYYGFNVTDLARQVNTAELANPMKLLTGNFDLSYVFVFLFPLLVVALFYNLYAGEKEGGTLSLLLSQSIPLNRILVFKGFVRLLIVWALAITLLGLGFILQGISWLDNGFIFLQWLLIIMGYGLFWSILMWGIIRTRFGSSLSAMVGLGVWLILTLITPALLNLIVLAKEPLPNRSEMVHALRNLNDQNWENPKSFVWDRFYKEYPHYNDRDTADFTKWYYASFTLLDQEASTLKQQFEEQVIKRNALLDKWEWLAPAAMVHEQLSAVSQTDRKSHIRFVDEVYAYHRGLKKLYYDHIFSDEQFSLNDLKSLEDRL